MNEELDYAEMLEIPVETVTVKRKDKKKRREPDLREQLVEQVNDRMEADDPAYAESTPIAREAAAPRSGRAHKILVAEFAAACALVATIFFTNIFMADSAINTFVRGLFQGETETVDTRGYADFTLSSVVNEYTDVEIRHSDSFSTILSGLDSVYCAEGEAVKANLPLGYSDGEGEVRVMFYSDGTLLNCYTVDGENGLAWS